MTHKNESKPDFRVDKRRAEQVFAERLARVAATFHQMQPDHRGLRAAISRRMEVAKSTAGRWLNGEKLPHDNTIMRIATRYQCDPSYLIGATDDPYADAVAPSDYANVPTDVAMDRMGRIMQDVVDTISYDGPTDQLVKAGALVMQLIQERPWLEDYMLMGKALELLRPHSSKKS